MSLQLELCREFLIALEKAAAGDAADLCALRAREADGLQTQADLLAEAGLVRPAAAAGSDESAVQAAVELTPSGREFVRLTKNDAIWKRACTELAAGRAPVTLQAVRARVLEWGQFSY